MVKKSTPKRNSTLRDLAEYYLRSPRFAGLKRSTQYYYQLHMENALATKLSTGKTLGDVRIQDLRVRHVSDAYEQWLQVGVRTANYRKAVLSAAWSYGLQKDIMIHNPIASVDSQGSKPRRVMWQREHVMAFLNTAYSDWQWRSVGLIVHMAYEWAQRIGDMRLLKWENVDLDNYRVDLVQSKRNADVHLPIGENLAKMLRVQREDFGFQPYVAPRVKPRAGAYTPYDLDEISKLINDVKHEANLPSELTAMDLRRTAITEMVEAGVDLAGVMQVSGHRNPQSVKPYLVNTFSGASAALAKRNGGKL